MADLVADANVLVASFLPADRFHQLGREYVQEIETGDNIFHLPTLVPVEVLAAVWRRSQRQGMALVTRAKKTLDDWEAAGNIVLYPLTGERMTVAINTAVKYRLSGADAVVAGLAEELSIPLKTFDNEIIERFHLASP
ncbi:MAG: PIN domain-containing protein [Chloroflexi bacterium]|nr:PIN domain-containing protein [Chloroflexota bacterium]